MNTKTEQLLFNYLEGNLDQHYREELEAQLQTDPALKAELNQWEKTYVTAEEIDFNLNEKLIIAPSFYRRYKIIVLSFFLITSLSIGTYFIVALQQIDTPKSSVETIETTVSKRISTQEEVKLNTNSAPIETINTTNKQSHRHTLNTEPLIKKPDTNKHKAQTTLPNAVSHNTEIQQNKLNSLAEKKAQVITPDTSRLQTNILSELTNVTTRKELSTKETSVTTPETIQISRIDSIDLMQQTELKTIEPKTIKKEKKHRKDRFENFDLKPDKNFIKTNDNF